jgi:hypothetical protein
MKKDELTKDYLFIQGEDLDTGSEMWVAKTSIAYVKESGSAHDSSGFYIFHIVLNKNKPDGTPIVCTTKGSLNDMNDLLKDFKI